MAIGDRKPPTGQQLMSQNSCDYCRSIPQR